MECHPAEVIQEELEHSEAARCASCQEKENGPCISHCQTLVPDETIPRAVSTLPSQLVFRIILYSTPGRPSEFECTKTSRRIFARKAIPAGTVYGPLVGVLSQSSEYRRFTFGQVVEGTTMHYRLDSDDLCNWMKYVRRSDITSEVNLMAYQHGKFVYFTVLKPLAEGDELCVGYSPAYARSIGKSTDVGQLINPSSKEVENSASASKPSSKGRILSHKNVHLEYGLFPTSSPPKRPEKKRKHEELHGSPGKPVDDRLRRILPRNIMPEPAGPDGITQPVVLLIPQLPVQQNVIPILFQPSTGDEIPAGETSVDDVELFADSETHSFADERPEGTEGDFSNDETVVDDSLLGRLIRKTRKPKVSSGIKTLEGPEGQKEKKKRGPYKKRTLPKIPKKLLQLKSSLPDDEDLVLGETYNNLLKKPRKKRGPNRKKQERDDLLEKDRDHELDQIISDSVANDLLGSELVIDTTVEPLPKKKRAYKSRSKAIAVVGSDGTSNEEPAGGTDKPKIRKKRPEEREDRERKEKVPLEVDTVLQTSKLPSAAKLLADNKRYKFRCKEDGCTADFRLPGLLAIHATKHGAEMPEELKEPGQKSCPGCGTQLPDTTALVTHVAEHERQYNRSTYISCDECGKKLRSDKYLKIHKKRLHSGEVVKDFACKECPKRFFTLAGLRSHENFHKEKGYSCPVCLESFMGGLALNVHSEKHRVDGKFPCRLCEKVYDSWLPMRRHMKQQHLKSKVLVCDICKKVCKRDAELKNHMLIHSEVYAFSCDECGRKFKRWPNLKDHKVRLHHPDRQYDMKDRSEKVAKSFANAIICTYCKRQYNSKERLLEHQRIKHGKNLLVVP